MDAGLLQGLAEGLKQGLSSYTEAADRKYRRDVEAKKLQKEEEDREERLGLLRDQRATEKIKLGMKKDEEGNWVPDPESEYLKKQKQEGLLRDAQIEQAKAQTQKTLAEAQKSKAEASQPGGKPPSGEQFKAAGFVRRLEQAEDVFNNLSSGGYDRSSVRQGLLALNPTSIGKNTNLQQQEQAEKNFINAVLRRESGAAISPSEFKNAESQYFDRPGDTPETKAQKKANRLQVVESLRAESGGAYARVPKVQSVGLVGGDTKQWNGKTYKRIGDEWVEQ